MNQSEQAVPHRIRGRLAPVLGLVLAAMAVETGVIGTAFAPEALDPVVIGAGAVAGFTLLVRSVRMRLELGHDDVLVANLLRSERIPLAVIDGVSCRPIRTVRGDVFAVAIGHRGRHMPSTATISWGWVTGRPSRDAVRLAEAVNAWASLHDVPSTVTARSLVFGPQ